MYLFLSLISSDKFRKIVVYSSILLTSYIVINLFFKQSTGTFNSLNVAILAILIIIWTILFFYEQLTKPADSNQLFIYSTPSFWIVTAYLIYFAGTFFLFIYSQNKNLEADSEFSMQYSFINSVFVLLKNILLSIAMFTKTDSKSPGKYRTQTY